MNRSTGATIARTGGRLAAALLPLAAFGVIRALPSALQGTPLPWVASGIAGAAALVAGLALLVAVATALEDGRVREVADAAGLGTLATVFAVVALEGAGSLGVGIGVAAAALAFLLGSLAGPRSLASRRERVIGMVVAVVVVEAVLGVILLSPSNALDDRWAPFVAAGGAVMLAIGAVTSLTAGARSTAIGIAASSAAVITLAGAADNERLVGAAGMAIASAVLGWGMVVGRPRQAQPAKALGPELLLASQPEPPGEPEFDELSRITRELRATLDDLVAARHLIELQRAEIDRASSTDLLTGLASRWPTLDRLRTEAAEARRYAHPIAVVLFDIDHFADLNHEHGLDAGDAILREIALRLRVRMREADAVGRIGADAFLAILPHTDEGGAATFANAVLDRLLDRRIVTDRGEITVSLSIGIALMRPGMTLSGNELLAAAEEALTSARAAGGNRIAFDRLHGLARLNERRAIEPPDAAEGSSG